MLKVRVGPIFVFTVTTEQCIGANIILPSLYGNQDSVKNIGNKDLGPLPSDKKNKDKAFTN
jgi:hypothetical protein